MSWVIIFCSCLGFFCLLIGALAGMSWEHHCAVRDARGDQAEAEAGEWVAELRETDPENMARRAAMARRTHPVYRERKTSTAAFLDPQVAQAAWVAHCEQAEDITREGPDVLAAIHADLDRFIAEVVHGGQQ